MTKYTDIIARLEKADGPDRELDLFIEGAVSGVDLKYNQQNLLIAIWESEPSGKRTEVWGYINPGKTARNFGTARDDIPQYTASLDAAIALCERMLPRWANSSIRTTEGAWKAHVWKGSGVLQTDTASAAHTGSRALATLLALFRALQAQETETA